jgi:hypothetical protein
MEANYPQFAILISEASLQNFTEPSESATNGKRFFAI